MTPIDRATQALAKAREIHRPVPAPDLVDAADAYAVQEGVARALHWFDDDERTGSAARHWKSGGPSREAQTAHAPLPPTGIWASPADARAWHFQLRGIEAEIALRMGSDVDAAQAAALDQRSAVKLIDAMCVSIELVDSRWREALAAPELAKLADLLSHGALVLGAWQDFSPRDWSAQVCRLTIGSAPALTFEGTHSMGDPAWLLPAWLRHATRGGRTVRAGTVLTTGTWCGLAMAAVGDRVRAEFPGVGSAEIQL